MDSDMVGTQQFNLRWNNHTSNILQVFFEHLTSELLVDVTLSAEGKFIKAHKIILSACSPYFQEVFTDHTEKNPLIILNGIKFEDLRSMIQFMYNGEIRVQETQLEALLAAAETLQVKGLSNVRSKYERGEITSLTPATQKTAAKAFEPPPLTKESPAHSVKATVGLFSPTAPTTRAPNSVTKTLAIATPMSSSIGTRAKSNSAKAAARGSSNASNKTVSIAPRPPTAPVPALAIATIMPTISRGANILPVVTCGATVLPTISRASTAVSTVSRASTVIPVVSATNTIRGVVPILPRPAKMKPSRTKSSNTGIKISSISSGVTPMTSSIIPITFTTPSINIANIASKRSKVKSVDTINPINDRDTTTGDTNFQQTLLKNDCTSITKISSVPSGAGLSTESTITKIDKEAEEMSTEADTPRIRKRRKMSHTVNELARETVFASNGTVLLEPDEAVSKKIRTNSIMVRTDLSDSTDIEEITIPSEAKKLMVKIQSKHPQKSLLIKDKNKKASAKIPRPPNAFMIFANEWRRKLAVEYPTDSNTTISVRLGIMWKGLSIKSKETFYRLAKKADEEHKLKYPGYYYSPKEARIRKHLKQDQILGKCLPAPAKVLDEMDMIRDYMKDEEKETNNEEICNSESEDDDDYTYGDEEDYEDEEEDELILEYSADEDEDVKPDLSVLEANTTHETKMST